MAHRIHQPAQFNACTRKTFAADEYSARNAGSLTVPVVLNAQGSTTQAPVIQTGPNPHGVTVASVSIKGAIAAGRDAAQHVRRNLAGRWTNRGVHHNRPSNSTPSTTQTVAASLATQGTQTALCHCLSVAAATATGNDPDDVNVLADHIEYKRYAENLLNRVYDEKREADNRLEALSNTYAQLQDWHRHLEDMMDGKEAENVALNRKVHDCNDDVVELQREIAERNSKIRTLENALEAASRKLGQYKDEFAATPGPHGPPPPPPPQGGRSRRRNESYVPGSDDDGAATERQSDGRRKVKDEFTVTTGPRPPPPPPPPGVSPILTNALKESNAELLKAMRALVPNVPAPDHSSVFKGVVAVSLVDNTTLLAKMAAQMLKEMRAKIDEMRDKMDADRAQKREEAEFLYKFAQNLLPPGSAIGNLQSILEGMKSTIEKLKQTTADKERASQAERTALAEAEDAERDLGDELGGLQALFDTSDRERESLQKMMNESAAAFVRMATEQREAEEEAVRAKKALNDLMLQMQMLQSELATKTDDLTSKDETIADLSMQIAKESARASQAQAEIDKINSQTATQKANAERDLTALSKKITDLARLPKGKGKVSELETDHAIAQITRLITGLQADKIEAAARIDTLEKDRDDARSDANKLKKALDNVNKSKSASKPEAHSSSDSRVNDIAIRDLQGQIATAQLQADRAISDANAAATQHRSDLERWKQLLRDSEQRIDVLDASIRTMQSKEAAQASELQALQVEMLSADDALEQATSAKRAAEIRVRLAEELLSKAVSESGRLQELSDVSAQHEFAKQQAELKATDLQAALNAANNMLDSTKRELTRVRDTSDSRHAEITRLNTEAEYTSTALKKARDDATSQQAALMAKNSAQRTEMNDMSRQIDYLTRQLSKLTDIGETNRPLPDAADRSTTGLQIHQRKFTEPYKPPRDDGAAPPAGFTGSRDGRYDDNQTIDNLTAANRALRAQLTSLQQTSSPGGSVKPEVKIEGYPASVDEFHRNRWIQNLDEAYDAAKNVGVDVRRPDHEAAQLSLMLQFTAIVKDCAGVIVNLKSKVAAAQDKLADAMDANDKRESRHPPTPHPTPAQTGVKPDPDRPADYITAMKKALNAASHVFNSFNWEGASDEDLLQAIAIAGMVGNEAEFGRQAIALVRQTTTDQLNTNSHAAWILMLQNAIEIANEAVKQSNANVETIQDLRFIIQAIFDDEVVGTEGAMVGALTRQFNPEHVSAMIPNDGIAVRLAIAARQYASVNVSDTTPIGDLAGYHKTFFSGQLFERSSAYQRITCDEFALSCLAIPNQCGGVNESGIVLTLAAQGASFSSAALPHLWPRSIDTSKNTDDLTYLVGAVHVARVRDNIGGNSFANIASLGSMRYARVAKAGSVPIQITTITFVTSHAALNVVQVLDRFSQTYGDMELREKLSLGPGIQVHEVKNDKAPFTDLSFQTNPIRASAARVLVKLMQDAMMIVSTVNLDDNEAEMLPEGAVSPSQEREQMDILFGENTTMVILQLNVIELDPVEWKQITYSSVMHGLPVLFCKVDCDGPNRRLGELQQWKYAQRKIVDTLKGRFGGSSAEETVKMATLTLSTTWRNPIAVRPEALEFSNNDAGAANTVTSWASTKRPAQTATQEATMHINTWMQPTNTLRSEGGVTAGAWPPSGNLTGTMAANSANFEYIQNGGTGLNTDLSSTDKTDLNLFACWQIPCANATMAAPPVNLGAARGVNKATLYPKAWLTKDTGNNTVASNPCYGTNCAATFAFPIPLDAPFTTAAERYDWYLPAHDLSPPAKCEWMQACYARHTSGGRQCSPEIRWIMSTMSVFNNTAMMYGKVYEYMGRAIGTDTSIIREFSFHPMSQLQIAAKFGTVFLPEDSNASEPPDVGSIQWAVAMSVWASLAFSAVTPDGGVVLGLNDMFHLTHLYAPGMSTLTSDDAGSTRVSSSRIGNDVLTAIRKDPATAFIRRNLVGSAWRNASMFGHAPPAASAPLPQMPEFQEQEDDDDDWGKR